MAFTSSTDIANRALQHVGARRISSLSDLSKQAEEINFCYDKLRRAELRRAVWRFATRRAMLRPYTSTMVRYIPPVWDNVTTFQAGQIVQDSSGVYWIASFQNTNQQPGTPITGQPAYWQQYFGPVFADTWPQPGNYNAGEIAYTLGPNEFFICTRNAVGNNPVTGLPWVPLIGTTQLPVTLLEPVGPSLSVNGRNRNLYYLPNGFLRVAAPDPKVESTSNLTTSGAIRYIDWQLEGDRLVSNSTSPILFRFVADVSDVTRMDDLFCEALAARIAYEICEPLTQSNIKLQAIGAAYQKFMREARMVNWIEIGATEEEEEEYELTKGPAGVRESSPSEGTQEAVRG